MKNRQQGYHQSTEMSSRPDVLVLSWHRLPACDHRQDAGATNPYRAPIRQTTTSSRCVTRLVSRRCATRLATLEKCRSIKSSLCLQSTQHPAPSSIPEAAMTPPASNCRLISLNSPEYIKTSPPKAEAAINPMITSHKHRERIRSLIFPKSVATHDFHYFLENLRNIVVSGKNHPTLTPFVTISRN